MSVEDAPLPISSLEQQTIWSGMAGSIETLVRTTVLSMLQAATTCDPSMQPIISDLVCKMSSEATNFISTLNQFCQATCQIPQGTFSKLLINTSNAFCAACTSVTPTCSFAGIQTDLCNEGDCANAYCHSVEQQTDISCVCNEIKSEEFFSLKNLCNRTLDESTESLGCPLHHVKSRIQFCTTEERSQQTKRVLYKHEAVQVSECEEIKQIKKNYKAATTDLNEDVKIVKHKKEKRSVNPKGISCKITPLKNTDKCFNDTEVSLIIHKTTSGKSPRQKRLAEKANETVLENKCVSKSKPSKKETNKRTTPLTSNLDGIDSKLYELLCLQGNKTPIKPDDLLPNGNQVLKKNRKKIERVLSETLTKRDETKSLPSKKAKAIKETLHLPCNKISKVSVMPKKEAKLRARLKRKLEPCKHSSIVISSSASGDKHTNVNLDDFIIKTAQNTPESAATKNQLRWRKTPKQMYKYTDLSNVSLPRLGEKQVELWTQKLCTTEHTLDLLRCKIKHLSTLLKRLERRSSSTIGALSTGKGRGSKSLQIRRGPPCSAHGSPTVPSFAAHPCRGLVTMPRNVRSDKPLRSTPTKESAAESPKATESAPKGRMRSRSSSTDWGSGHYKSKL